MFKLYNYSCEKRLFAVLKIGMMIQSESKLPTR